MPDIAPMMPLQPTPPQALAGVAPVAPAAAGMDAAMQNSDFLGQLKAALKSLAGVMTTLPAASPAQVVVGAATTAALTSTNDQPAPAKASDQTTTIVDLSQIVAALGLVVTPTPVSVAPTVDQGTTASSTAAGRVSATPAPLTAASPVPFEQQPVLNADPVTTATPDKATPDAARVVEPAKPETTGSIDISGLTPINNAPAPTTHVSNEALAAAMAATDQMTAPSSPAPAAVQPTHQASTTTLTTPLSTPLAGLTGVPQFTNEGGSSHHNGEGSAADEQPGAATNPSTAVPDHTFAAVAQTAATASTQTIAQPEAVHPGEVVSQIAHQADLYRLPGNKGVRIQLHPEDLGGVQVTIRYGAAGGLELHIAVEHAATGALVQAGWSELRDALATQGISPDRLALSVTAPASANQLDFSSNGNGYRSEAGLSAFADGGQSGQKRDGSNPDGTRSVGGGLNGNDDIDTAAEVGSRTAVVGAASRIDYRV